MYLSRLLQFFIVTIWFGSDAAAWSGSTRTNGIRWQPLTLLRRTAGCYHSSPSTRMHDINSFGFGPASTNSVPRCFKLHVQATMDDGTASPQHSVLLAERTQQEQIAMPAVMEVKHVLLQDEQELMKQRIINGIFLAVSFGYVVYTILNIDHGMTRGWTHEEQLLR